MSRSRFRVVLILLVLILVVASILFGVLTYGLAGEEPPASDSGRSGRTPARVVESYRVKCADENGPGHVPKGPG